MACFHLSYDFELWDGVSKTGFYLWEFCKTLEARRPEKVVFTHARHRHSQSGARDLMFLRVGFPRKHKTKTWSYECAADSFPDPRRFPRQHLPWWGVPRDVLAKQSHGEAGVTQRQPVQPRACPTPEGLLGPRLGLGRLSRLLGAVSPPRWSVASLLTWGFRCLRSQRKSYRQRVFLGIWICWSRCSRGSTQGLFRGGHADPQLPRTRTSLFSESCPTRGAHPRTAHRPWLGGRGDQPRPPVAGETAFWGLGPQDQATGGFAETSPSPSGSPGFFPHTLPGSPPPYQGHLDRRLGLCVSELT